tara:strand:+ start:248 stop:499 length:252 start_codon:yes stop_codon:yes gene_type:complete
VKARRDDLADPDATNQAFREEVDAFKFHYRCGSCAHIHRATMQCSLGYPNHYLTGPDIVVQADGNLTFCKYFEVGETLEPLLP